MNRVHCIALLLFFMLLNILRVSALDYEKVSVRGSTDHDAVHYKVNEIITFTFTAQGPEGLVKGHTLRYLRTGDDGKVMEGEASSDTPLVLKTKLDRPGFIRFQVTLYDSEGKVVTNHTGWKNRENPIKFDGGAGVEITKIKQAVAEPEDFEEFWKRQKNKLAKVPVKYDLKEVKSLDPKFITYDVKVDCAGPRPVTGYLVMPVGAKKKSLEAVVTYAGYGVSKQNIPENLYKNAFLFAINAHGFELDKDPKYYSDFSKSLVVDGKGYLLSAKQLADPETSYLNGMALRVLRSLEFVKQLPEWNGKDLIVAGGSQGGLQSSWAAGLDDKVTKWYTHVTFGCDMGGGTIGRIPHDWGIPYVSANNYYDPVNHAKRIKCPVIIRRAGLGDYRSPPSGIAILYNNIPGAKEITYVQGATHGYVPKSAQSYILKSNGRK